jgi:hypothetical protein
MILTLSIFAQYKNLYIGVSGAYSTADKLKYFMINIKIVELCLTANDMAGAQMTG